MIKANHKPELKELQAAAKDIQIMLPAQRERIDVRSAGLEEQIAAVEATCSTLDGYRGKIQSCQTKTPSA